MSQHYAPQTDLQSKVLGGLSLSLGFLIIVFVYINLFINEYFILAAIEVVFSFLSFWLFFLTKKNRYKIWHKYAYVCCILFVIVFASLKAPLLKGIFLWGFCLPTIFYVLLGVRSGFFFSLATFIFQYFIFLQKVAESSSMDLHLSGSLNFAACYIVIWVVSHVYESNRASIESSLYRLANTDSLTGTQNRLAFNHRCNNLINTQSSFCLLLIDVDYFKQVNDQYGHETGDDALKAMVKAFSLLIGGDKLFRYGGEEFCVLFEKPASLNFIKEKAELIRKTIEQMSVADNDAIKLTVSIGVVEYKEGMSLVDLLSVADERMYKAKLNGRNQVVMA